MDKILTSRRFSTGPIHRSRASLIAARVGDYARGTVGRSGLGNWPSIPSQPSEATTLDMAITGYPMSHPLIHTNTYLLTHTLSVSRLPYPENPLAA